MVITHMLYDSAKALEIQHETMTAARIERQEARYDHIFSSFA
jgi:hypothetical protein